MILVFDLGTSSVKISVFDEELRLKAQAIREYRLITAGDRVELDPEVYWQSLTTGLDQVFAESGLDRATVKAVTVTTQGETLIAVDADGRPLDRAIVWLDGRAVVQGGKINDHFGRREFYRLTGIPECTGIYPAPKLMWFKEERPEIFERAHKFLLLEDFILWRLCGRWVTEKSLLCTTGYFDLGADDYARPVLDFIGLDTSRLPEAVECGTPVGRLSRNAARELGLSPETLVVAGAMDQMAAALGCGNLEPGLVSETTGSGLTLAAATRNPDFDNPEYVPVYRHVEPGLFLLAPVCMCAGIILKWFRDEFCAPEVERARREGRPVYELLGEIVAGRPPEADRLVLLPYFSGLLQPDSNPRAKGVFFGVTLDTGRPAFLRAIFEAVAFQLRENLELIARISGLETREVLSLGGGGRSPVWRRIKADVTGLTVCAPAEPECSSLGAAILAGRALGRFDGLSEAAARANSIRERVRPDPAHQDVYDEKYRVYQELYTRLRTLFQG